MAHTRIYRGGSLVAADAPVHELKAHLAQEDTLAWLDLCPADGDHLSVVADELGLDPLAVEDALTRAQRPKVDRYPSHLFLALYTATVGDELGDLRTGEVSVFVTDTALVTVHDRAFHPEALTAAWDGAGEPATSPGALLLGLLRLVVASHQDVVGRLDEEVDALEDALFGAARGQHLQRRLFTLRKTLVALRRVVLPMREVLNTLLRRDVGLVPAALTADYQDVYDHVLRASEWTESLRDMVSTIFETHLSMQDHHLNDVMKKLASWAAIISVPTAITGYFGQNVPYPGFGKAWGFWVSLVAMVAIGSGLWAAFRRRDWL